MCVHLLHQNHPIQCTPLRLPSLATTHPCINMVQITIGAHLFTCDGTQSVMWNEWEWMWNGCCAREYVVIRIRRRELIKMEMVILVAFGWRLNRPTLHDLMEYFLKILPWVGVPGTVTIRNQWSWLGSHIKFLLKWKCTKICLKH